MQTKEKNNKITKMELQKFITETLKQIVNGVVEAQKDLKDTGCLINPEGIMSRNKITQGYDNQYRTIQHVKMNIVLSVSENEGTASKIGVFKVLQAGFGKENTSQNSQMTTLEFEIPIALPVMENESK